ncbi:uncharacterized protein LOC142559625 [Dermacentor variabilis]|uniref:uncharacterized protein LOC142559625 n=1 Tax=Dermacentor variabilis TaxID=34621 RepID=UPI003F5CB7DF
MLVAPPRAAGTLCPPNYCDNVTCTPIKSSECDGKVEVRASDCGCCEQCVKQLNEGDVCFDLTVYGLRKWGECKRGLKCNRALSKCERSRKLPFEDDDDEDKLEAILGYL